jgi:hypothetical protein
VKKAEQQATQARGAQRMAKAALASMLDRTDDFDVEAPAQLAPVDEAAGVDALIARAWQQRLDLRVQKETIAIAERTRTEAWTRLLFELIQSTSVEAEPRAVQVAPDDPELFRHPIAVLAGDALQALAFQLLAQVPSNANYNVGHFVSELAITSGSLHLIGGQVMDLEGEGKKLPLADLRYVHESKTAALLTTSMKLGGMCVGASPEQVRALHTFGWDTGLAFQIIDDILDVTQTTDKLGKSAGKDLTSEKSTYPALLGLQSSRDEAHRLTNEAMQALDVFGDKADALRQLAEHLLNRDY